MADDFNKREVLIEIEVDSKAAEKNVENLTSSIIDQQTAIKQNTEQIKDLEKANKSLDDEVKKGTKTQEQANKELVDNSKSIKDLKVQNAGLKDGLKDLNRERLAAVKATKTQSNTLQALRNESAKLKKELNQQETATEEGRKAFDKLTDELKETNDQIRELDGNAGDFKTNIGNYQSALEGYTGGFIDLEQGVSGNIRGFKGLIKQSLAFIATPIGAILGAIVAAFLLVKNAMDRSEESTAKITRAFSAFEGITNFVLKALEPLGEFLIDGIVAGFEAAGNAAQGAMSLISDGLSLLGFDDAAKSVDGFNKSITESVVASQELADMESELQVRQRESAKIQLEYQKQAEKLRQIRDDDSKSIEERISANEKLGDVLKEQLSEEQAIADLRLAAVNRRIDLEGETTELLDQRAEALTEIADIQERITGQESEQLTNRNALLKEANDAQLEALEQSRSIEEEERERLEETREKEKEAEEERRELEKESLARHLEELQALRDKSAKEQEEQENLQLEVIKNIEEKKKKIQSDVTKTASNIVESGYRKRFANLEKQLKNGQITEEQYAKKKEQLEKKKAMDQYKVELASYIVTQTKNLAVAGIDIARSITASVAAFPLTGGMPFAGINAGIGALQIAAIASTPPPQRPSFAEGGVVVKGKSHAQGGEDIYVGGQYYGNMQGDEGLFVTKKEATKALLNDYNTAFGGRSFYGTSTTFAQEGGRMEAQANQQITAQMISEAMQESPAPQVQVVDIMSGVQGNEEATNIAVI